MKKSIEYLLYLAVFAIAWPASNVVSWNEVLQQIIIVIVVITAAVFVRLNRALPRMEPTNFRRGQIQRVAGSYVLTSNEMAFFARTIIGVLAYGVLGLKPLENLIAGYSRIAFLPRYILCVLFGYVLVRSLKLITLDLDFMKLQSEIAIHEANLSAEDRIKTADEAFVANYKTVAGYKNNVDEDGW